MKVAMLALFVLVACKSEEVEADRPHAALTGTVREVGPHAPIAKGDVIAFAWDSDDVIDFGKEDGTGLALLALPLSSVVAKILPDAGATAPPA